MPDTTTRDQIREAIEGLPPDTAFEARSNDWYSWRQSRRASQSSMPEQDTGGLCQRLGEPPRYVEGGDVNIGHTPGVIPQAGGGGA